MNRNEEMEVPKKMRATPLNTLSIFQTHTKNTTPKTHIAVRKASSVFASLALTKWNSSGVSSISVGISVGKKTEN